MDWRSISCLGLTVFEISPRWTARQRRNSRRPGKSDHLDARAVARCVREEAPKLLVVNAEDETVVLDLLSTERDAAVAEATRLRNQIHALLSQTDPQYAPRLPALTSAAGLRALESYVAPCQTLIQEHRTPCATAVARDAYAKFLRRRRRKRSRVPQRLPDSGAQRLKGLLIRDRSGYRAGLRHR